MLWHVLELCSFLKLNEIPLCMPRFVFPFIHWWLFRLFPQDTSVSNAETCNLSCHVVTWGMASSAEAGGFKQGRKGRLKNHPMCDNVHKSVQEHGDLDRRQRKCCSWAMAALIQKGWGRQVPWTSNGCTYGEVGLREAPFSFSLVTKLEKGDGWEGAEKRRRCYLRGETGWKRWERDGGERGVTIVLTGIPRDTRHRWNGEGRANQVLSQSHSTVFM